MIYGESFIIFFCLGECKKNEWIKKERMFVYWFGSVDVCGAWVGGICFY